MELTPWVVLPAKLMPGVSDQDQIHRFSDSPTTSGQETAHTDSSAGVWESNFRERMHRMREAQGMTQTDLARVLKNKHGLPFHQQTIQRIETGERPIRLNEANLIAQILNLELSEMIADVGTSKAARLALQIAGDQLADRVREIAAHVSNRMGAAYEIRRELHAAWAKYEHNHHAADQDLADGMDRFERRYEAARTAGQAIMEVARHDQTDDELQAEYEADQLSEQFWASPDAEECMAEAEGYMASGEEA